jgi:hypothetical protein
VLFFLKHSAAGMAIFWVGGSIFFFTNYAAARRHELWLVGPSVSAFSTFACFLLSLVSVIAGATR